MAFSTSHMFRQWISDCLTRTATPNFATDTFYAALYGNTISPNENDTAANTAYNGGTGQWLTANEIYQAGQWAQGGVALTGTSGTSNFSGTTDAVWYSAANTASGSACTLANVYGDLVYDFTLTTPVAKQGVAFHYYGGVQGVTSGTFTVIWNTSGVWRITV
jgi:hypothetical protein